MTATYAIDADAAMSTELAFILPVDAPVTALVGPIVLPAPISRVAPAPDFTQRLDMRHEYILPDGEPLPPLYEALARVSLRPGRNQISFSYDQPLGAVERGRSYFHDGTMVPRLLYVLWPLREWKHAPEFTIALRIEMDREPPGWWKRTFGHPADIYCDQLQGQQAQVGQQLVYSATLTADFPDYLRCSVGP